MPKGKSDRYKKNFSEQEQEVYEKEYKKAIEGGVDRNTAIKFSRTVAKNKNMWL